MALDLPITPRARRMLASLPSYYDGNELVARMIVAAANELDRRAARQDALRRSLIPTLATDELDGLARWESILELPIKPAGATVAQRVDKVAAALRKLDSSSAADTNDTLRSSVPGSAVIIFENDPAPLEDTIQLPFDPGSYNAAQVQALAQRLWPAHRLLHMRYSAGFILDVSRLDVDTL